jgi:hypothetical protein
MGPPGSAAGYSPDDGIALSQCHAEVKDCSLRRGAACRVDRALAGLSRRIMIAMVMTPVFEMPVSHDVPRAKSTGYQGLVLKLHKHRAYWAW